MVRDQPGNVDRHQVTSADLEAGSSRGFLGHLGRGEGGLPKAVVANRARRSDFLLSQEEHQVGGGEEVVERDAVRRWVGEATHQASDDPRPKSFRGTWGNGGRLPGLSLV